MTKSGISDFFFIILIFQNLINQLTYLDKSVFREKLAPKWL